MWACARGECARAAYRACQVPTSEHERLEVLMKVLMKVMMKVLLKVIISTSASRFYLKPSTSSRSCPPSKLPTIEGVASTSPHR